MSSKVSEQTDRVKLPISFDTEKLLKEVNSMDLHPFEYYSVIQLRAPAHLVDTSLPFPPPADDYADGSWTDWMNTRELNQSPYLLSIVEYFQKLTDVTLVRVLRLAPHSEVKEHTDPTLALEVPKSVIRLTVPITKNNEVEFYLNNKVVPMNPGECWYLKLNDPHKIYNSGDTERINLSIDMIPNDSIRSMINELKMELDFTN